MFYYTLGNRYIDMVHCRVCGHCPSVAFCNALALTKCHEGYARLQSRVEAQEEQAVVSDSKTGAAVEPQLVVASVDVRVCHDTSVENTGMPLIQHLFNGIA